jgi:diguanylate cyclase (GGDEF)-like protein/PAS domain S-box-containing protein
VSEVTPGDHGTPIELQVAIVRDATEVIVTVGDRGTITSANPAITRELDWLEGEVVGRNVAEFVHPDDLDRALIHLSGFDRYGAPGGYTSFRLAHRDGSWRVFDVVGAGVFDGEIQQLAVYARPAGHQHATDEVLARLLTGSCRLAVLEPVLDLFDWSENDAHVSIAWFERASGHHVVSTGLPRELTGADDHPGSPWAEARATGRAVLDIAGTSVDPERRAIADEAGRGGVWVVPVPDAGSDVPALITIWQRAGGPRPDGHSYGMGIAQTYVELILRWSNQVERLEDAAHRDSLTGLANRKAFFDVLADGPGPGALLYGDLDRFKAVNDRWGHAAGDAVLRHVAARIVASVGATDLVARIGGDEFVVLLPGASLDDAEALAERVRAVVAEPVEVGGSLVRVGITLGVAHAAEEVSEDTLAEADYTMLDTKGPVPVALSWSAGNPADAHTEHAP